MKTAQISVDYVEHMGTDLSVVNAARQSFNKQKTVFDKSDESLITFLATGKRTKDWEMFLAEIRELAMSSDDEALKRRLIAYKREAQHWAPFAHPHVTLRLRMPIFLARQFVKHQIGGAWSEESRRYIDEEPEFYFEPVWMKRPEDVKQGAAGELEHQGYANAVVEQVTEFALSGYLDLTRGALQGEKMAPEQAREILTLNTMTGVTWTGSLLFWSRVCNQRLDGHAQSAAQHMASQISGILRPMFPVSWKALVE